MYVHIPKLMKQHTKYLVRLEVAALLCLVWFVLIPAETGESEKRRAKEQKHREDKIAGDEVLGHGHHKLDLETIKEESDRAWDAVTNHHT